MSEVKVTGRISGELSSVLAHDGDSAYEIAVRYGFEGTEEEWLASLKEPAETAAEEANASEVVRKANESIRQEQEQERITAEAERQQNEAARKNSETARSNVELIRTSAETERAAAEANRAEAENIRAKAEENRVLAETLRANNESARASAEAAREQAEADRIQKVQNGYFDGDSAYQVAVKNGYKGTEQEWLKSLSGVYLGSGDMPNDCYVQIDPNGDALDLGYIEDEIDKLSEEIDSITEVVGTKPDNTNLWTLGDVTVYNSERFVLRLSAGEYTISALINSTSTDSTKCCIRFYAGETKVLDLFLLHTQTTETTFTLSENIDAVRLYASSSAEYSKNNTAIYTNVTIIDNNAVINVLSAVDTTVRNDLLRTNEDLLRTNSDVQYTHNPNIYNGGWTVGRYKYDTGEIYSSTSSHCRNDSPVRLDYDKEYNVEVKKEFSSDIFYVLTYDADKNFIACITAQKGEVAHITNASFINFSVSNYANKFPNEPLHVMVWESNDTKSYAKWLEYGELGNYTKNRLVINEATLDKAMVARDRARFDSSFNYIAYSNVAGSDGRINTADHFKWACKQGFTSIKGDVRPTSDGILIMCHDAGFSLNSSGKITGYSVDTATPIHDMTAEQCLALQHSNGNYVCSFDEYIKICKKYGKIAYITIRDEYIDEVVAAMFPILDKYNMRTRCIVNSFTLTSLQAVRAKDNSIMLSQVLTSGSKISEAAIDRAIALGNCMICGFDFPNFGEFDDIAEAVVAYAKENDIRLYEAQVDSMEKVEQLMEYGISGAQMTVVPVFD